MLQLRKENQELREALTQTQELLRKALARIAELEKQKTPPPAFVKAKVKKATEENRKAGWCSKHQTSLNFSHTHD